MVTIEYATSYQGQHRSVVFWYSVMPNAHLVVIVPVKPYIGFAVTR
jgi:hypothetical protein